jgi:hypothetical protein
MMGLIYRSSERTLAWLGDDEGHAEAAFSLVHNINDLIRGRSVYKVPAIQSSDPLLSDPAPWESLERLSRLLYFTRAWIQQEVGLAKKVVFHWGDQEILRDPLVRSMLYVDRMIRAGDLKLNMGGTPLINTCTFFETASGIQDIVRDDSVSNTTPPMEELFLPNFLEVLLRASRLQASDPRDLVFAFLGHPAALVGGSPIIKADYTKTIEEVYTQAAAAELVGRNNFHALSMVSHEPSLHGRLPSWVPDFQEGLEYVMGCSGNPLNTSAP